MTVKPAVIAAWRADLEAQIIAPGPLAFSRTLALTVARESPRFEVRSAWERREREAWAARVLAGLASRSPITADEIRTRLFARPLPRRRLRDGRLGPQAYATEDPLPLP